MKTHSNAHTQMESYVQNGAVSPGASCVTDRRSVTFFPSGSSDYGPEGVRVIEIPLNVVQWVEPRSVKLFFDITDTTTLPAIHPPADASAHTPGQFTNMLAPVISGPWAFSGE